MDLPLFAEFLRFLERSFPRVHRLLELEDVGEFGRVYRLDGADATLDPVLFLAHYDVVPAGDEAEWTYPPFAGVVADGSVWGRGALDDKGVLMALLEALEGHLEAGFRPARSIYLAFGADEEVSGTCGAARIAALFAELGVTFEATFDEGMIVSRNMLSFLERPVALIGIAEKGYVDLQVRATGMGGHASMPPAETAAARLASSLLAATRQRRRGRMIPVVEQFFRSLANAAPGPLSVILRRPSLFAPLLTRVLSRKPTTAALVRTTVAPTMLSGSEAPNVLPANASAVLNCRVLPGQSVEELVSELRSSLSAVDGARVDLEIYDPAGASEPVEASSTDSEAYRWVQTAIGAEFPEAVIAPFLVTGTTDSRHYRGVSRNIYRFVPLGLDPAALATIHGVNERLAVDHYYRAIRYYERLFELAGGNQDE